MKTFRTLFRVLVLSMISVTCTLQDKDNPLEDITVDELRDHVYYLASDDLQGRKPGTAGYNAAANYAATQFLQAGLKPIYKNTSGIQPYFQQVLINEYELDTTNTGLIISIEGTDHSFSASDRFSLTYQGPFDQNEITGQAVFIGYGIHEPDYGWDDYQGIELNNKWAVMLYEIPDSVKTNDLADVPVDQLSYIPRVLKAHEAGALGVINVYSKELFNAQWNTIINHTYNHYELRYIRGPRIIYNCPRMTIDSAMIRLLFKDQPFDPLDHTGEYGSFNLTGTEIKLKKVYRINQFASNNILAIITGTDTELRNECVTVGAHLDHLGIVNGSVINGADDNASGSAAVLEIAERVAQARPKRSVLFLLYTAEEIGLLGSWYFVNNAPFTFDKMIANINLDMIGRPDGDANDLAVVGADRINPKLKEVIFEVNNRTLNLLLDSMYTSSVFERSDQFSFYIMGIPSVLFITGLHNDYHTPHDDADKIDYDYLHQVSNLVYGVIMELANDE